MDANTKLVNDLRRMLGNKVFGATFIKANGETRTGSFRLGVHQGVKGTGLSYDAKERGNLIVFDMNKRAHRTIPLRRVIRLRVRGNDVHVVTPEVKE